MEKQLIGLDIGGTKCSVVLGVEANGAIVIKDKVKFATTTVRDTINMLISAVYEIIERQALTIPYISAIGISCGGPLDSKRGIILSPPNLKGWNNTGIVEIFENEFGIKTVIQNDANACALAEWKFGAGRGTENMVFLTFGTGLGAGMILNGKLYSGTNDNAGEVGHIRLSDFGPVGYGKAGSFEGFCSGSGIAQLAKQLVCEKLQMGIRPEICPSYADMDCLTAKKVAEYAKRGDKLSLEVCRITGQYLGKGLSIIIDLLNPEKIVIGSIYERSGELFDPYLKDVIESEALDNSAKVCQVVPAELGDSIGDIAALSVAATL